jgi:AcrR family transcriptional regulator
MRENEARDQRKRRKSADVRADIVRHATSLFAQNGFAAVTVRDISQAANVPMSGIYRYFSDKEALHTECELTAFQEVGKWVYQGVSDDLPPEEMIYSITRNLCSVHSSDADVAILLLRLMQEGEQRILKIISDDVISGPSELLLEKLRTFPSRRTAIQNLYSIYAMSFGFAKMNFLRDNLGWPDDDFETPQTMAVFILETLFPRKRWRRFILS